MKSLLKIVFCSSMLLVGCNTNDTEFTIIERKQTVQAEYKPSLKVDVRVDGSDAIVSIDTDLELSSEEYGQEKIPGQGHIHLYLNEGEKQGITSVPVVFENLKKGQYEVRISLHNNDHTPYGVRETVEFEIK